MRFPASDVLLRGVGAAEVQEADGPALGPVDVAAGQDAVRRLDEEDVVRPPRVLEEELRDQREAPERSAGLRPGVVGRGLVRIVEGGPPDFVQVTSEGGGGGHLARSAAIGFHFLVRREGLAESIAAGWGSQGKIVARRDFGGVGMARDFHWEAAMEDSDVAAPQAVAAAEQLNARILAKDRILALLQEPNTLAPGRDRDPHAQPLALLRGALPRGAVAGSRHRRRRLRGTRRAGRDRSPPRRLIGHPRLVDLRHADLALTLPGEGTHDRRAAVFDSRSAGTHTRARR